VAKISAQELAELVPCPLENVRRLEALGLLNADEGDGLFPSSDVHVVRLMAAFEEAGIALENVARVMAPDGVLFGVTVLGRSGRHTRLGRAFLWAFNKRGAFGNLDDTETGLREILQRSFRKVKVETTAGVAVFEASEPIASSSD